MKSLMLRTVVLIGGALAGWLAWQKHRDVSNPWPPGGWNPSTPPEPEPQPEPEPKPEATPEPEGEAEVDAAAEAETEVESDVSPEEAPVPEAEQAPEPAPEAPAPVLDLPDDTPPEDPVVAFANTATAEALREAGLSTRVTTTLLDQRPFEDAAALAATKGIGPKTLAALDNAVN